MSNELVWGIVIVVAISLVVIVYIFYLARALVLVFTAFVIELPLIISIVMFIVFPPTLIAFLVGLAFIRFGVADHVAEQDSEEEPMLISKREMEKERKRRQALGYDK